MRVSKYYVFIGVIGLLLLCSAGLMMSSVSNIIIHWDPRLLNSNMNAGRPNVLQCPPEIGDGLCDSLIGHLNVTDACEYRTDTPTPETITYYTNQEGVSIDGMPLEVDKKYVLEYFGGSVEHQTCVLDFSGVGKVNFEIVKKEY